MSKRSDQLLMEDILESIKKIIRYTKGLSREALEKDEMRLDAVVRNFEVIGEAANRIPKETKAKHPQIVWRRIIGFGLRNRIVHEYFGIDVRILWAIIQHNLFDLQQQIAAIDLDFNHKA
jgi:uncharacterized protein with HEPN domain